MAYARERPCGGDAALISILTPAPPHGDGRGRRFLVGLPAAACSMAGAVGRRGSPAAVTAGRRGPRSGRSGARGAAGRMGGEERRVGMGGEP